MSHGDLGWSASVGLAGTNHSAIRLVYMKTNLEIIGKELRRVFAAIKRPMGWNVIDAFTRLEEREEARRAQAKSVEEDRDPPAPDNRKV